MEDIQCHSDTICDNQNANYSCEGLDFVVFFKW